MNESTKPAGCPHVDLFAPATQQDWYPAYDDLRENDPVHLVSEAAMYVLSRYEDVAFVSKRTDLFANGPAPRAALMQDAEALKIYKDRGLPRYAPLSTNPPVHRRYRQLVDHFFTLKAAEAQRPLVERVVNELIDEWIDEPMGEIEFVKRFALPLPVIVITSMLGFPLADIPQLKLWSEAWVMPFAGGLTPEQQRYVAEKGVEFQEYILGVIADKRRDPDGSVISFLAHTTFDAADGPRPLTDEEILFTTDHLYIGGNETTTFALTSGLWLMLRSDSGEAQDRLRADPTLVPQFVEENLRLESPTQGLYRHTLEDVVVGDTLIPKGSTVHLRFAAANRDNRMFASPATLDLDRSNSARHMAFGVGEHHCPGAGLSRFEQTVAFETLLRRTSRLSLLDSNEYRHQAGFVLRALEQLHVGFSR